MSPLCSTPPGSRQTGSKQTANTPLPLPIATGNRRGFQTQISVLLPEPPLPPPPPAPPPLLFLPPLQRNPALRSLLHSSPANSPSPPMPPQTKPPRSSAPAEDFLPAPP